MLSANLAAVAYLVCGVLFILALRGLSSPVTSRRGNTASSRCSTACACPSRSA